MAVDGTFRVGITPDWGAQTNEVIGVALREVLEPLPNLEWEMCEETGGVADPAVMDKYDAVIVFGYRYPAESLVGLKRVKCLARWGVGFDRIDIPAATENDVMVALTPKGIRRPVAEGIVAFMFALGKNMWRLDRRTREGRWRDDLKCESMCLLGRSLGSVGLGNIAQELMTIAKGIGMGRLMAFDPFVSPEAAAKLGVDLVDLDTLMRESDFVAVNTPLNEKTHHLVGAHELSLMKPSAYFINTARGPVVDEEALIEVMRERRIAGAGLDVFDVEPARKDHPFFEMDNVIVAPHSIAWTEEGLRDNSHYACANVREVYYGRVPEAIANRDVATKPSMLAKLEAGKMA